jgi:hypothetical protein
MSAAESQVQERPGWCNSKQRVCKFKLSCEDKRYELKVQSQEEMVIGASNGFGISYYRTISTPLPEKDQNVLDGLNDILIRFCGSSDVCVVEGALDTPEYRQLGSVVTDKVMRPSVLPTESMT